MSTQFNNSLPSQIDSEELNRIKSNFKVGDNYRSESYEQNQYNRKFPEIVTKGKFNTGSGFTENTLVGLSYPLELDGNGGIKTASNYERISQQIIEVLDTRIGERVLRRSLGLPELIFETLSESVLSQVIKKQILSSLPLNIEMEVSVEISDNGIAVIFVGYSLEGSERYLIKYGVKNV